MHGFRQWILATAIAVLAGSAWAQPTLTTVQDTLYKADGTRYSGTAVISWTSFQSGDSVPVATQQVTLQVVNGVLKVRLVPTTTASPGANYTVNYSSQGKLQFSETWAVPPSSTPLRIRDVRVSTGTVVGPPALTTPIYISDVSELTNELSARPQKGSGFAPSRAAVLNFGGQIDGASGNPGDCVRVDGSSGPCGGGGGGGILPIFVDGETPAGLVNGMNLAFALNFAPSPTASLEVYRNGIRMKSGVDFTLSNKTITFFVAAAPQTGDILTAAYRYGDPANPLGSFTSAQVICSSSGTATSSATLQRLGSCTIPAGVLVAGDRISVVFQYSHEGSTSGVGGQILWGGTAVLSRSTGTSETYLGGRIELGLHGAGAAWNTESWGVTSSLSNTIGNATDNYSAAILVDFRGQVLAGGADTTTLRSFSVVRYPAQVNP
ncbi:MAG: hypothetical protein ABI823_06920 [Bryobacteraceae bacterium]